MSPSHLDEKKTIYTLEEIMDASTGGRWARGLYYDQEMESRIEELIEVVLIKRTDDGRYDCSEYFRHWARERLAREQGRLLSSRFGRRW